MSADTDAVDLQDIIAGAVAEFAEWIKDNPDEAEPNEGIGEIAGSNVPIYTADLIQLGADNWELMMTESEIGPAFDGTPTPLNILAANVYDAITTALWERWQQHLDEQQEAETQESET